MTNEELDKARATEAEFLYDEQKGGWPSTAVIAARLARENWTPPEPADPDVLAVREVLARPEVGSRINSSYYLKGKFDNERSFKLALAAYKAGRAQEQERAKVLVEYAARTAR
jgi:hypothetical protein